MKQWYAVHTHAHGENRAYENLARQDFESWLPKYRKRRRHAGREENVLRPLFPRYLFVRVDLTAEQWRPILSTRGVASLVGDSEGPHPLGDEVITALQSQADENGIFDLQPPSFQVGEKVRITAGPLSDLEGVFQMESDSDRVMVLLKLMGRSVRVSVAGDDLEQA
jgi:transcriptional antiterminator RfaH